MREFDERFEELFGAGRTGGADDPDRDALPAAEQAAPADQDGEDDELPLRAEWMADGASTPGEVAAMLRGEAAALRAQAAQGFELVGAIDDDWGFISAGAPTLSASAAAMSSNSAVDVGGSVSMKWGSTCIDVGL